MFNKFFKFLKGYVIIKLYGHDIERFVNICVRRGIVLGALVRGEDGAVLTDIGSRDFFRLPPVAFKTKTKVRIIKKCGLYNLKSRYGKRYALIGGAVLFAAFFAVSSRFIWTVEINGAQITPYESIENSLRAAGVYSGALKSKLPEGEEIKSRILSENTTLVWAWVYIEGAKARVEVYEKIIPPSVVDKDTPCDIAAACDGYIKNVITKNGKQLVKAGDTVNAGDVLISGTVPVFREGEEERYMEVHSLGTVEAYTTHRAEGLYKTFYESRIPTGRHKTFRTAEIFGKAFKFYRGNADYENYDTSESRHELKLPFIGYTGLALISVRCSEVEVHKEPISIDTVKELAKNELEEKISKELLYDSSLEDEELSYSYEDGETVRAALTMNFIEKIGTQIPIDKDRGVNNIDNKAD